MRRHVEGRIEMWKDRSIIKEGRKREVKNITENRKLKQMRKYEMRWKGKQRL